MIYRNVGKRALDVGVASLLLALITPLAGAVSLVLLVKQGRPILFRQERAGLHEETFTLLKFRTMREAPPGDPGGAESARITPVGAFLRTASLDELPELVNVLLGDMSLVGPRPLPLRYTPYFRPEERARFSVRPGITGLAQVSGRNDLAWHARFALDTRYASSVSLVGDLKILMRTIAVSLKRSGVQVDPGAVMQDLDVERAHLVQGRSHPH